MATCRQTITAALRKVRILGVGRIAPNANEAADGLAVLQGLCVGLASGGAFGRLKEVIATAAYTAGENERIRDGGFTITIPDTITDPLLCGPRPPYDLSLVVVTGTLPKTQVYDAFAGAWISLLNLTLDSTAPFSGRDPDACACWLAAAYAEEFGKSLGPLTLRRAGAFNLNIMARFSAPRRDALVDYF